MLCTHRTTILCQFGLSFCHLLTNPYLHQFSTIFGGNCITNYNGCIYNVMVEWETGEITEEPLSIIAQDDPVTCAAYAKKHNLLHLPEWNKLKYIAKHQKTLTRAINQTRLDKFENLPHINLGFSYQGIINMPWN